LRKNPDGTVDTLAGLDAKGVWHKSIVSNARFEAMSSYIFAATGGGGWGNPLERDPGRVLEDVLDEYVSLESAEKDYGVIIDRQAMKVDLEATWALRKKLSNSAEYQKRLQGVRKDYRPFI